MNRLAATAVSVLALTCIAAVPDAACAQDYPSHPIKLVLPQPPGGAIDLISRALGERLSEQMKQPVIVENMPGANGGLGARAVGAGRLHAVHGGRHQSRRQSQSLSEPSLRPGPRFCTDRRARKGLARAG